MRRDARDGRVRAARFARALTVVTVVGGAMGCGAEISAPTARENPEASARGEAREGVFATSHGIETLRYTQVGEERIFEGDIQLPQPITGTLPDPSLASAGRTGASYRWPDNTVVFDSDIPSTILQRVTDAMQRWTSTTPIRFRPRTNELSYVRFRSVSSGCSSSVGRQTGAQNVDLGPGCDAGSAMHEIGHAVGLWHEQSRADRDAHLDVDLGCVPLGEEYNFWKYTSGADYGLYDFHSAMHYWSTAFVPTPAPAACNAAGFSVSRRGTPTGASAEIVRQRDALSVIDRQGVEEMYSESYARAVTVGDFDGDGDDDVAIGAPRAGSVGAGHVYVYRATPTGLALAVELDQGAAAQSEDRFGYSLAAGDFNGDGLADLAVGLPGENGARGRVVVYEGHSSGALLTELGQYTQTGLSTNEVRDRFGWALSAGDYDGDGDDDLAVGAPGETVNSAEGSGAVYVFDGTSTGLVAVSMLTQTGLNANESGDDFGAALTSGDFDGDGDDDLAVGAPHERDGALEQGGMVYVFKGGATMTAGSVVRPTALGVNYTHDDMLFGYSLAAGDIDHDGRADLVVGAPGATINGVAESGRVFFFRGAANAQPLSWGEKHQVTPVTGAGFGFSLAMGLFDYDVYADLAVGVPGGTPEADVASGQVTFFSGATTGLLFTRTMAQHADFSDDEAGDRFGAAVAIGNFNPVTNVTRELIVGAPGEVWSGDTVGRAYTDQWNGNAPGAWGAVGP